MYAHNARTVLALALLLAPLACPADVWYVNANQLGANEGKSWETAFTTIQPAIDAAHAAGGGEVWVAAGAYGEQRSYIEDGIETGALLLRDGVSLYGGFAGNEDRRTIRDFERNVTAISGKTSRNGKTATHVITGSGIVRLDGLVVRDGFANGDNWDRKTGGGLKFSKGSLTIENCIFADNIAMEAGAGVHVSTSSVTLFKTTFRGNIVLKPEGVGRGQRNGGGIVIGDCKDANVRACIFSANHCQDYGGGLYINNTVGVVSDSTFEQNGSGYFAGGAYVGGAPVTFEGCAFFSNGSSRYSGGLRVSHDGTGNVKNCRFEKNFAQRNGGAMSFMKAKPSEVVGCTFIANKTELDNGGAISAESGSLVVRDSSFERNSAPTGGAMILYAANVQVENCVFKNNQQGTITQIDSASSISVIDSKFDTGTGHLFSMEPTKESFANVGVVQQRFPLWKNNINLASPAPIPATAAPPRERVASAPTGPDSISIKTAESEISVIGTNTVIYVVTAVFAIVFLLLVFGWFLVAQRRGQTI